MTERTLVTEKRRGFKFLTDIFKLAAGRHVSLRHKLKEPIVFQYANIFCVYTRTKTKTKDEN